MANVVVERREAIQIIRMDRPEKKNALTAPMYKAMAEALRQGDEDGAIRVQVILGTPGIFSAGNDIGDFLVQAEKGSLGPEILDFLHTLPCLRKPLISGVDGIAVGVGATLHLHCDLTLATSRTSFHTPFVDLALVPEAGSSLLAPALMGRQRAFAMLVLGEPLPAEEARQAGLIWKIVAPEDLEKETIGTAAKLADKPPEALLATRNLLRPPADAIIARIDEEAEIFSQRLGSKEAGQAFQAFFKRKGNAGN